MIARVRFRTLEFERRRADTSGINTHSIRWPRSVFLEGDIGAVVQSAAIVSQLDNLDTSIGALLDIQAGWDGNLLEAKGPITGLVEGGDEGDVESRNIVSHTQVDESLSVVMGRCENQCPSVEWPGGAVRVGDGLVHTSARVIPLSRITVPAPVWISKSVMGRNGRDQDSGGEEGEELHCDCRRLTARLFRTCVD